MGEPEISFNRTLRLHPEKWFDFFASDPTEERLLDLFQEEFSNSCMSRIPDEVGFMSTLSGGIDSTLVNVFASQYGKREIDSLYGISSDSHPQKGADINELEASRITSKKLNTKHHVFSMIDDSAIDIYKAHAENSFDGDFDEVAPMYNQLADQVVSRNDKVLLISDGPDELLGGYVKDFSAYNLFNRYKDKHFRSILMRQFFQNQHVHRFLFKKNQVDQINWSFIKNSPFRFRPAHGGTSIRVLDRLFNFKNVLSTESLYGKIPDDYSDLLPYLDFSQKMALSYAAYSLPDHYNLRTDRGAMRSSVEVRMPWQSPRMVELMIATPERWRFCKGNWSKYLFRRLVERHVGKEIAYRNKYGFGYPLWRLPRYAAKMNMRSAISDSSVFRDLPFKSGTKKFLLSPNQVRNHWIAYSLALTHEQLKNKNDYFWK